MDANTPISRAEHEEFRRRIEEENRRQNARIQQLEDSTKEVQTLSTSIEKLAVNMENMLKEQKRQGERLEALEGRDGELWRAVVKYAITAAVGIVVGYVFTKIGF